jgi:hypothetical protein
LHHQTGESRRPDGTFHSASRKVRLVPRIKCKDVFRLIGHAAAGPENDRRGEAAVFTGASWPAATGAQLAPRPREACMARPNIRYPDSSLFVQLCPQCASRMTIRSIAPVPQDPAMRSPISVSNVTRMPLGPSIADRERSQVCVLTCGGSLRLSRHVAWRSKHQRCVTKQRATETECR